MADDKFKVKILYKTEQKEKKNRNRENLYKRNLFSLCALL
jgi:hypothetical protein